MLINLQQGVLPNVWRFVPFDAVITLARRLESKPLSDNSNGSPQVKLFNQRRNSGSDFDEKRTFMDWRRAFTILCLIAGKLPNEDELESYKSKLRAQAMANEEGVVTKKAFIKVSNISGIANSIFLFFQVTGWFDKCEATPLVGTIAGSPTKMTNSQSQSPSPGMGMSPSHSSPSQVYMQAA